MPPLSLHAYTVTCATGVGMAKLAAALHGGRSGLRVNDFTTHPLPTWIGRVEELDAVKLPEGLNTLDCRNNRLAWLGLQADGFAQAVAELCERVGPARVGLALGTSTSSIGATEQAYRERDAAGHLPPWALQPLVHTPHSLGLFVQRALGLGGPSVTLSTACSSSAKVFGVAQRWLSLGMADAVVVGGVDSLCNSVLFGFHALQLVSPDPCRPFDRARAGINIGEAAGYALLTRADLSSNASSPGLQLLGVGESSDAHHMSAPHPMGLGAELALGQALERSGMRPQDIDYLNLHGTASAKNDEVEAAMVARHFGPQLHASSTKGWTGHTLGAAGIVEAAVCLNALQTGLRPGTLNARELDASCGPQVRLFNEHDPVRVAMSNSFGFGGSNCVLVFGRAP